MLHRSSDHGTEVVETARVVVVGATVVVVVVVLDVDEVVDEVVEVDEVEDGGQFCRGAERHAEVVRVRLRIDDSRRQ